MVRRYSLELEEKPRKMVFLRAFLLATTLLFLTLAITGVVVFSSVHGTSIT